MVFSSPIFLFVFLPFVIIGNFLLKREYRNVFLLLSSLVFYAWGEPILVLMMIFSIFINYMFGLLISKQKEKHITKFFVVIAVSFNILVLVYFKYLNFLLDNLNVILSKINLGAILVDPIILPLGISFLTFHAISYVVDVYRKDVPVLRNPLDLGLYFSLFPHLIAGPIVRYHDIAKEMISRNITLEDFKYGMQRFILGLGKKVLIANSLGSPADKIFAIDTNELTTPVAWLGIICYSLQLYYDFSGYSDMAIGLARMLGFRFLENFNYPYISKSIREFWRRWHISLSNWFRDYLYVPLGGNRRGSFRVYFNLFIVFLATGLWHGSHWNFVIWGLIHGVFMIIERKALGKFLDRSNPLIGHVYTLIVVMIGWVFFRSNDLVNALGYLKTMFIMSNGDGQKYYLALFTTNDVLLFLIIGILGTMPFLNLLKSFRDKLNKRVSAIVLISLESLSFIYLLIIFILCIMSIASQTYNPFIYFRF